MTGNKNAWRAPLAGLASLAMIATMGVAASTANAADPVYQVNYVVDGTSVWKESNAGADGTVKLGESRLISAGFDDAANKPTGEFTGWYSTSQYGVKDTLANPASTLAAADAADGSVDHVVNLYAHYSKTVLTVDFSAALTGTTHAKGQQGDTASIKVADKDALASWQLPEDSDKKDHTLYANGYNVNGTSVTLTDVSSLWGAYDAGTGSTATLSLAQNAPTASHWVAFNGVKSETGNKYDYEFLDYTSDPVVFEVAANTKFNGVVPTAYRAGDSTIKVTSWIDIKDSKTKFDPSKDINQDYNLRPSEAAKSYTVKFYTEYSRDAKDLYQTVETGEDNTVAEPTAPTKKGYKFLGWYKFNGDGNPANDAKWNFKDNVTDADLVSFGAYDAMLLYAKWEKTSVDVTFDPNYGQEKDIVLTFKDGDTFKVPTVSREGYVLDGWFNDSVNAKVYVGSTLRIKDGKIYYVTRGSSDSNTGATAGWIEFTTLSFKAKWAAADEGALKKQEDVTPASLLYKEDGSYKSGSDQKTFTEDSFEQYIKDYQQYLADKADAGTLTRAEAAKLLQQLKDAQSKLVFNTTKPVYRLYSEAFKRHLVTSSKVEKDFWQANGYKYEGEAFKTVDVKQLKKDGGDQNTIDGLLTAVHRLYNPGVDRQHLTPQANEIEVLTTTAGWRDEGVAFYAPANGTTPVYRVYIPSTLEHLWTTNANEYDTLGKNPGVYQQEGVDFSL